MLYISQLRRLLGNELKDVDLATNEITTRFAELFDLRRPDVRILKISGIEENVSTAKDLGELALPERSLLDDIREATETRFGLNEDSEAGLRRGST